MEIKINDRRRTVKDNLTVETLVQQEYPERGRSMVAAINDEVIPQSRWDETVVEEGDDVLIFMPVKGGSNPETGRRRTLYPFLPTLSEGVPSKFGVSTFLSHFCKTPESAPPRAGCGWGQNPSERRSEKTAHGRFSCLPSGPDRKLGVEGGFILDRSPSRKRAGKVAR